MANTAVVYGREYGGNLVNFEASGGLIHSSLVMQDKETDSYWSIMTGAAIAGKMKGTKLEELPIGVKTQWKDWVKQHPKTLALSVMGVQDHPLNPYDDYLDSEQGFRGANALDKRLKTKEPIFAFQFNGKTYAVPFKATEKGNTFELGEHTIFLYRPQNSTLFHSTIAYITAGAGFEKNDNGWFSIDAGCKFDPEKGSFQNGGASCPKRFKGFDTFWYNWSLTHPDTIVLE